MTRLDSLLSMHGQFVRASLGLLAAWLLASAQPVQAHDLNLARIEIIETAPGAAYEFAIVLHADAEALAMPEWPAGCQAVDLEEAPRGAETRLTFRLLCDQPLAGDRIFAARWGADGAVISMRRADGARTREIFRGGALEFNLGAPRERAWPEVMREYVALGGAHIWAGWDHLAFVLTLCLLVGGLRLVELVTAFTVGHSISLALAFLGVLTIPIAPVEAVIALSIVFMAREALMRGAGGATGAAGFWRLRAVVAGFGLLHGLGFASALSEIGVSRREIAIGLMSFNIGVELGQLAFVAVVVVALQILSRAHMAAPARLAALWGAGLLGGFWTVSRLSGFG